MLSNEKFFLFFFQKFRKMAKTKKAKIVNFYFFFEVFQKTFTKKDKQSNIISLESCLVLVTNRNSLSKYGNMWPFFIKIWQLSKKAFVQFTLGFFFLTIVWKFAKKKKEHLLGYFSLKNFWLHRTFFFKVNFMKRRFKKFATFYFILF